MSFMKTDSVSGVAVGTLRARLLSGWWFGFGNPRADFYDDVDGGHLHRIDGEWVEIELSAGMHTIGITDKYTRGWEMPGEPRRSRFPVEIPAGGVRTVEFIESGNYRINILPDEKRTLDFNTGFVPFVYVPSKECRHPEPVSESQPQPPEGEKIMNTLTSGALQNARFFPGASLLTADEKRWMVNPLNPENPFCDFVGQEEVVSKLSRLAFQALGRNTHDASDISVALLGPSGTGKTTVARLFAQLLELPFVPMNPKALKNTDDVFEEFQRALTKEGLKMTPQDAPNEFRAPPCLAFIDEVHQLSRDVEQGLLTACEANTATMETPSGRVLDTSNVCWVIATTDRGALFDAFEQRFSKAYLKPYTRAELTEIVWEKKPNIPPAICKLITRYCCVSREAIDFATEVEHERNMNGGDWDAAVEQIRKEQRIDEYGMSETRLAVLKALGDRGPISVGKLQGVARVKVEELDNYTLPPLMEVNEERDALIQSSSRGYYITPAGLKELERRNIRHNGIKVLPKR